MAGIIDRTRSRVLTTLPYDSLGDLLDIVIAG